MADEPDNPMLALLLEIRAKLDEQSERLKATTRCLRELNGTMARANRDMRRQIEQLERAH